MYNKLISTDKEEALQFQRSIASEILFNVAPWGQQLKTLTGTEYIKRIVHHQFVETNDPNRPIAVIFKDAYCDGVLDTDYMEQTRSKDLRPLEKNDPLCIAVRNQNVRKNDRHLFYSEGEKNGEYYHQFTVGNNLLGVTFRGKYSGKSKLLPTEDKIQLYSILDHIRYVSFSDLKWQFVNYQGTVNLTPAELRDVDFGDAQDLFNSQDNYENIITQTMKLLNEYFGFKRVDIRVSNNIMLNLGLSKNEFSEKFSMTTTLSESLQEADGDYCQEYSFPWGGDHLNDLVVRCYSSKDRDKLIDKHMDLESALACFSNNLYRYFTEERERLELNEKAERIAQERDHLQRIINIMRSYQSLPQLKEALNTDIKQYFDVSEGMPLPWITFHTSTELINAFSDYPAEEVAADTYELFVVDKAKVVLHIPKSYQPKHERHREWFDNYISFLTIAMDFFLQQYELDIGLSSLGLFFKKFNSMAAYLKRFPQARLAVMWVDGYKFKMFNETFGHIFGDSVLKSWATHLAKYFPLATRVQGDEFLIAFPYFVSDKLTEDRQAQLEEIGFRPEQEYIVAMDALKKLADNVHESVYFTDAGKKLLSGKEFTVKLADVISNFFVQDPKDPDKIIPRELSREGDAHTKIIDDPDGKIQELKEQAFAVVLSRYCKLGDKKFVSWVWENNSIGAFLKIHPQFSFGEPIIYSSKNPPGYKFDILADVETAWSRNKKQ